MLEKTPPLSGPWLSETLAALFSCFHQLPGDLVTSKAQRNAHKVGLEHSQTRSVSCFYSISSDRRGMPLKPKPPEKAALGKLH